VTAVLLLIVAYLSGSSFVADASAEYECEVEHPAGVVRNMLGDIHLLERAMPGVVAIVATGDSSWLYRTERHMPFSDVVYTDFLLVRSRDTAIVYRTPDTTAANWMSFRFELRPCGNERTTLTSRVRVRLVRSSGTEIHVFAPVLGESFISDRMHEDLYHTLETFATNLRRECPNAREQSQAGDELR
jgi:hypothetical protein